MSTASEEVVAFVRDLISNSFGAQLWPVLEGVVVTDAGDSRVELRWLTKGHQLCTTRTSALALHTAPDGSVQVVRQECPLTPDLDDLLPAGVVRIVEINRDLTVDVLIGPPPPIAPCTSA